MYIIGVYGLSGAGKSTLSEKLASDLNATYINADKYWKSVYYSQTFQKNIVPYLKKDEKLVKPDDYVDCGAVRIKDLKVSKTQAIIMRKLLYQYLNYRVNRKLKRIDSEVVVVDHIKFFEFDAYKKSDFVIYVNTPADICQQNIMKRDYITQERMQDLIDEHVVENHEDFKFVPHDFEISAFSDNFENNYEYLLEKIKQNIILKHSQETKNKMINLAESNERVNV